MAAKLELIVDTESAQGRQDHGWIKAALHLNGVPYWYGEGSDGKPSPLDWTWVDLLQYLGKNWSALMLEQGYPLPLANIPHPGKLMQRAEARWEDMPETLVYAEENLVLQYLDRHNLATALSGANVPMLIWLRSGNTLWLIDEDEEAHRVDFFALREQLETIGDTLAELFASSSQPHVQKVIAQWVQRGRQLQDNYLAYTTGLDAERLATLQRLVPLAVAANDQDIEEEPVYLAAARMTRHHLSIEQIAEVIQYLQQAPSTGKQPFATLMVEADAKLEQLAGEPPFEQGYQLARWLRGQLHVQDSEAFDPEKQLNEQGVAIQEFPLISEHIDAIACWGTIDPLILINSKEGAWAAVANRRRTTLAHEICHLLVDRTRALPVVEVLGGEVDNESEKRANAFAAELLLPQAQATKVLRNSSSLHETVETLAGTHQVSKQLVANQLYNAVNIVLSEDDRVALRNYGVR